jgi:hypothetical protein
MIVIKVGLYQYFSGIQISVTGSKNSNKKLLQSSQKDGLVIRGQKGTGSGSATLDHTPVHVVISWSWMETVRIRDEIKSDPVPQHWWNV